MSARRLPIGELAWTGVRDMIHAARAAPGLFVAFVCAAAAAAYVNAAVPEALGLSTAMDFVFTLAVSALVTAAVAVALHRFVILSETNSVASLARRWRTVLDFATVLFGAQFLIMLPSLLAMSIWGRQEAMPSGIAPLCVGIAILGFLALLRYLLVFPAIAIDAVDRSLESGAAGVFRVALPVVVACILAMFAISLAGSLILAPFLMFGLTEAPYALVLFSILGEIVISAATVAIVSRAYLWREGRWPPAGP